MNGNVQTFMLTVLMTVMAIIGIGQEQVSSLAGETPTMSGQSGRCSECAEYRIVSEFLVREQVSEESSVVNAGGFNGAQSNKHTPFSLAERTLMQPRLHERLRYLSFHASPPRATWTKEGTASPIPETPLLMRTNAPCEWCSLSMPTLQVLVERRKHISGIGEMGTRVTETRTTLPSLRCLDLMARACPALSAPFSMAGEPRDCAGLGLAVTKSGQINGAKGARPNNREARKGAPLAAGRDETAARRLSFAARSAEMPTPANPTTDEESGWVLPPNLERVVNHGCRVVHEAPKEWKVWGWVNYRWKDEEPIIEELERLAQLPANETVMTHIRSLVEQLKDERKKDWEKWVAFGDDFMDASKRCDKWMKEVEKGTK